MDKKIQNTIKKIIYSSEDLELSARQLLDDYEQEDRDKILEGMIKLKDDISKQISKLKKEL